MRERRVIAILRVLHAPAWHCHMIDWGRWQPGLLRLCPIISPIARHCAVLVGMGGDPAVIPILHPDFPLKRRLGGYIPYWSVREGFC